MNTTTTTNDILEIASADVETRRGLFLQTGQRLGCAPENIEKDFWVCWTLDALFNKAEFQPRLLFKGGTSLSKAFGLIKRFSEDIDITVFRTDFDGIRFPDDVGIGALSRKRRETTLDEIKAVCQRFIHGEFYDSVHQVAARELDGLVFRLESDPDDPDQQSLLFHYPSVFLVDDLAYVRRVVKIEAGAKSALDPSEPVTILPYVAADAEGLNLAVPNVRTIIPGRTFWDKVLLLHGQRRWFENKGALLKDGQRLSRHYYDVYMLLQSDAGRAAVTDLQMAADCKKHEMMFFHRGPKDLQTAVPGTFALVPSAGMIELLVADYAKMADMVFGEIPPFDNVIEAIGGLEAALNGRLERD